MRNPMSAVLVAATLLAPGTTLAAMPKPASVTAVPMKQDGGVYVVPVSVNGAVSVDCIVDSGATDVSLPAPVFRALVRSGAVRESDMLGTQVYALANGAVERGRTVRLRSLKVGGIEVHDVTASIGGEGSSALLGQSFLRRFASWSLDNHRHALLLAGLPSKPPAGARTSGAGVTRDPRLVAQGNGAGAPRSGHAPPPTSRHAPHDVAQQGLTAQHSDR